MPRRSSRSFGSYGAALMLPVVTEFQFEVRKWISTVPIGSRIYLGLSILYSVLNAVSGTIRDDDDAMRRLNPDCDTQ
jgi:hypothetical protein